MKKYYVRFYQLRSKKYNKPNNGLKDYISYINTVIFKHLNIKLNNNLNILQMVKLAKAYAQKHDIDAFKIFIKNSNNEYPITPFLKTKE